VNDRPGYSLSVSADDTRRRSLLAASIQAGRCIECGGPATVFNHGKSIYIDHRDHCSELAAVKESQIPDTFKPGRS
jgi:hypothetical protein